MDNDKSTVDDQTQSKLIQTILREARQWEGLATRWTGLFPTLYERFKSVLWAIANNDRNTAVSANSDLFVTLNDVHDLLIGSPFGSATTVEELKRIFNQLSRQREQLEDLKLKRQEKPAPEAQERINRLQREKDQLLQQLKSVLDSVAQENIRRAAKQQVIDGNISAAVGIELCLSWEPEFSWQTTHGLGQLDVVETLQTDSSSASIRLETATATVAGLDTSLKKWLNWQVRMVQTIRYLSNQVEDLQATLEEVRAEEAIGATSNGSTIDSRSVQKQLDEANRQLSDLLEQQDRGEDVLRQLKQFVQAHAIIRQGVPKDLLKDPGEVPDFFSEPFSLEPEVSADSEESVDVKSALERLAHQHRLSTRTVFFTSLYELVKNEYEKQGKRGQKGQFAVLFSAEESGLLETFGWKNAKEFFEDWPWRIESDGVSQYLRYCGSFKGKSIYVRTNAPLPWDVSAIFSREQIEAFVVSITHRSEKLVK